MYTISDETKSNIERTVGLKIEKINQLSLLEEKQWVEEKRGEKLTFSKQKRKGIVGRGNPLLARKKMRLDDDFDQKSKKYIGI